jgi:TPR repeat protein
LTAPPGDGPAFTYHLGYAHRGNGEAMLKVAQSYESGRGVAQSNVWACSWYELAGRRGVPEARARKEALVGKLQPRELKQCQDWADGQSAPSG